MAISEPEAAVVVHTVAEGAGMQTTGHHWVTYGHKLIHAKDRLGCLGQRDEEEIACAHCCA